MAIGVTFNIVCCSGLHSIEMVIRLEGMSCEEKLRASGLPCLKKRKPAANIIALCSTQKKRKHSEVPVSARGN